MKNEKQYFTEEEMKERIIEELEYCSKDDILDAGELFDKIFSNDYYIVYTSEAKKALGQYGVFEAISEIQEYEKSSYGEILTEFSDPSNIANTLWYIHGEHYLFNELDLYQYETVGEVLEALQDGEQ